MCPLSTVQDAGVNSVNRMGRTPLHMACYDNLVDSHAGVISVSHTTYSYIAWGKGNSLAA